MSEEIKLRDMDAKISKDVNFFVQDILIRTPTSNTPALSD